MSDTSSSRYIGTGGRITFRSGITIRDFSSKRLAFIVVLGLLLFLSNPGNQYSTTGSNNIFKWSPFNLLLGGGGGRRRRTFQIPLLGIEINVSSLSSSSTSSSSNDMMYPKHNINYKTSHHQYGTNYHLFTLTKTTNGIDIGILNNNINLCNFNTGLPNLCRILSNHACHNDQLSFQNKNNQAFTILRILQIMKISSFLLQFCYKFNTYMTLFPKIDLKMTIWNRRRNTFNNITQPFIIIWSIFHETNSIRDLISLSFFVYPSLIVWERIVRSTITTSTNPTMTVVYTYFISITIIILLFIGGMSNLLSSMILSNKVGGMKGCIASSLGFLSVVSPNDIVVNFLEIQLTASEVLFGTFVMTILPLLLGFQSRREANEWDMGNIVSWTIGGIIGVVLGEYQKDRLLPWIMRIFL